MNCANHNDRERVAFCQNCGKPLCQECMRTVGSAVYCEPCLAAKLDAAGAGPAAGAYSYNNPAAGVSASGTQAGGGTYTYTDPVTGVYTTGTIPPGSLPGAPKPGLAALLGCIPGVGAMYNEQYAKGIVHLVVFAVLTSLADSHGIFALFVAGWMAYMVFDAYHTARARRDGLPLPNPFGLNELGEKLGFGKSWPGSHPTPGAVPPADPYASPYTAPPAAGYSAPYTAPYTPPGAAPFTGGAVPPPQPPSWEAYVPPMPPMPPNVPLDQQVPYPGNRFPAGALWLIGFGALFLIANAGFFHGISARLFLPFLLIGLAVFVFVRKMTSYGGGLASDGTADYHLRVFRALRGSAWIALVGVLFFLDEFRILSWGHSWPLFIILAGVMTVLQRSAYSNAAAAMPPYGYGYPPQPVAAAPPAAAAPTTEIVSSSTHDQEGR